MNSFRTNIAEKIFFLRKRNKLQAGPGLSETGEKCSPRQKCWPMRENKNTFIWEPMAALQDGMVFGTRKGIFKTFTF